MKNKVYNIINSKHINLDIYDKNIENIRDWKYNVELDISDSNNIYNKYFTYKYSLKGDSVDEILKQLPISEIENFIRKEKMKNLIDNLK